MKTLESFKIENCKSAAEALEVTGNNWKTTESTLFDQFGNKISTHKAIVREDNHACLGIVGKDYQPMELTESFDIFDNLLREEKITLDSLKVFEGGKKVVYTSNLQSFDVQENDKLTPKMHIVQSFDGSKSYQVFFTMYRLVCTNGLVMATDKSIMNIRHTITMPQKVQFAEIALKNAFDYFDGMKQVTFEMVKTQINNDYTNHILDTIIGKSVNEDGTPKTRTINIKEQILDLYVGGQGNNGRTKWDLYNSFTEYTTHYRGNEENREYSNLFGSGYELSKNAFNAIRTIAA